MKIILTSQEVMEIKRLTKSISTAQGFEPKEVLNQIKKAIENNLLVVKVRLTLQLNTEIEVEVNEDYFVEMLQAYCRFAEPFIAQTISMFHLFAAYQEDVEIITQKFCPSPAPSVKE